MNELLFLSLKSIYLIFLKISFLIVNQKPVFFIFISSSHWYFVVKHFRLNFEVDDCLIDDTKIISHFLASHWSSLHPCFPEVFSRAPDFIGNFIIGCTSVIITLEETFNWELSHCVHHISPSLYCIESIIELFCLCWRWASNIHIGWSNH